MTSIGLYAFNFCNSLASVIIGDSITILEEGVFSGCSALKSVTFGNGVETIGDKAFSDCKALKSVTIPNSVTRIGSGAFSGCSGLTTITIPNSVTRIRGLVFRGCDISKVISKIENPFAIDPDIFSRNTYSNATLYVPVGTLDQYKATEGWKYFSYIEEGDGK